MYPDVIESGTKTAQTIKSHHNVGGLPEDMQFQLIEPLNTLFKDEVRAVGIELWACRMQWSGDSRSPVPGLGVRCPGRHHSKSSLEIVARIRRHPARRDSQKAGLAGKSLAVLYQPVPDLRSVGVHEGISGLMTYACSHPCRQYSIDAHDRRLWKIFLSTLLQNITNRITNEVQGVNRVALRLNAQSRAGTIEWE